MIGRAKKNGNLPFVGKAVASESVGICPVCNKKIKNHDALARKIDGLWLCGISCVDRFLKEKKKWTPKDWDALCSMQALYEERKRAEISNVN